MITDKNFADWHADVFGYGYGSGEELWIPALRQFFVDLTDGQPCAYDHSRVEDAFGQLAAWLLINTLCSAEVIEYGTSPRFGWLTPRGKMIREYMSAHSVSKLAFTVGDFPSDEHCMPDYCNCTGTPKSCNPLYRQS